MKSITAMLAEIPELVCQVDDAPRPKGTGSARPVPGSRPPLSLAVLHAHMPDGGREYVGAGLRGQLGMCVRMIIEEDPDSGTPQMPDYPSDTWSGICGWLAQTHDWWSQQPWADDISHEIRQVWGTLRGLAHITDHPRFRCTRYGCRAVAEMQEGGRWVRCASGHTLDVEAERGRHLSMQDWSLAECRKALLQYQGKRVPQSRLEKWVERGQLLPIRHEWRKKREKPVAIYNFGAVMRLVAQWELRHAERQEVAG